jgi:hypothetical protein
MDITFLETLNEFDFHMVQRIMKMMNWTWSISHNDTPTIQQMRDCVTFLYDDAVSDVDSTQRDSILMSGGFEVTVYKDKSFDIRFVPVEYLAHEFGL